MKHKCNANVALDLSLDDGCGHGEQRKSWCCEILKYTNVTSTKIKKPEVIYFSLSRWVTSISDMVQNNFTHQEVHEISSKGVSGAEVLCILVDRAFICLPDHDWYYPTLICFLKKLVLWVGFTFSCAIQMIAVSIIPSFLKMYLLLYVCVHAEWGGAIKCVRVRWLICGVSFPLPALHGL